jgi:hypothetical protein
MSKIILYEEAITGVTTNGEQYALFINEDGLPTVKNGSQVVVFGTSGYAMQGSSGSSGLNGTNGLSGTSGEDGSDGSSGQDGEMGSSGTSGVEGSSGTSGADGLSGDNGSSGSSGLSYGTSGLSGSAGSSGTSLAKVYENVAPGFSDYTTNQTLQYDAMIYFLDFSYANPSNLTQIFALSGDTFNSYTNTIYGTGNYLTYSHLKGKKLTSVTLDRLNSFTPPLTGKTESLTTSAYFKIWKGSAESSGVVSLTEVYSYDLDGIIDFNYTGSTERVVIDLTGENIQAGFNEFLVSTIEREYEPLTSTSKYLNKPGITIYFETVASGILGTNGTSGQNGSAGSSGFSGANGTSGLDGTNGQMGSAGTSGLSYGTSGTSGPAGSAGSDGSAGIAGSNGTSGVNGSTGSTGSTGSAGANGTSGTSSAGGGAATHLNVQIHYTGQTVYDYYGTAYDQWKTTYFNSERIDRGTGDGYITKVWGYIVPFTLKPNEKIKKLGGYINSKITGTKTCKVAIFNNHPHQDTPYEKLYESELTVTLPGYSDLVWSTWDYNYQHTGTTEQQFWFMMLYPIRANNDFEWSQGYRDTFEFSHVTSVYPLLKTNQFMVNDDTMATYNTIPNFSYFISNNTHPILKAELGRDRTLPICWQTELNP